MAEEICRRRWKSLRDTYQREKKRESSEKRSVLSFLDPCITPRETSGNMGWRAEGGGPWKSGQLSPERRREQRQQQGVSQGSRQVKTQHHSLVKEKIHMAEEAGAISHAPDAARLDASGVNTLLSTGVENAASDASRSFSTRPEETLYITRFITGRLFEKKQAVSLTWFKPPPATSWFPEAGRAR
ncbi:hypothetical protein EYF80_018084 [Liparis tanakae]|uniref:MADF domain-containing protein n=1 Tax=Liparis tanakae TaxID=230148 RepID=A0A4Z2I3B4_9TELE|nr:hypothetical protein EYF80_018084 [Liparis tanakae]